MVSSIIGNQKNNVKTSTWWWHYWANLRVKQERIIICCV
jgi:hypothetical protein